MVETRAHSAGSQIARADDEHGVETRLLGVGSLCHYWVCGNVGFHKDYVRAEFVHDWGAFD